MTNARFLWYTAAELCQSAIDMRKSNPDAAGWYPAVASIILAALSTESFIHEISFWGCSTGELVRKNDPSAIINNRLYNALKFVEQLENDRASTISKYYYLSHMIAGQPLEKGSEPLQALEVLFSMRNDLVHPKVKRGAPNWIHGFYQRGMTFNRKGDAVQLSGWYYQMQTPEIAAWACQTARRAIRHIQSQVLRERESEWMHNSIEFHCRVWDAIENEPKVDWFRG